MKSFRYVTLCGLEALLMSILAAGQGNVQFQMTPTANTCHAPWVITMHPPNVWIAPQNASVLNFVVNRFATPHGNYVAPANRVIQPGNLCYFENCQAASIRLRCNPIGPENKASAEGETIILKPSKAKKPERTGKPADEGKENKRK